MDHPDAELVIHGGEITCFGATVAYDYKLVETIDGALAVSLKVNDPSTEDAFKRANVTGLFLTPDGEFHAYNVKFASQFVRSE